MMKRVSTSQLISLLCALSLALLVAACAVKKPAVSYYRLAALEPGSPGAEALFNFTASLGIGPVEVAEYLKKPQLAVSSADNRYQFSDFHRWAGIMEKEVASVLGDNLGLLLNSEKIDYYPWRSYFKPDYRVVIDLLRLDGDLQGEAVLSARWAISDGSGKTLLAAGRSEHRQALDSPDYPALVAAENRLLAAFSSDLALALQGLTGQN